MGKEAKAEIETRYANGVSILDVSGEVIDIKSSYELKKIALAEIEKESFIGMIINLGKVPAIDSICLIRIVRIYTKCQNKKRKLALFKAGDQIKHAFSILGLDRFFEQFNDEDEAFKFVLGES